MKDQKIFAQPAAILAPGAVFSANSRRVQISLTLFDCDARAWPEAGMAGWGGDRYRYVC
jgi:hypothetical protein